MKNYKSKLNLLVAQNNKNEKQTKQTKQKMNIEKLHRQIELTWSLEQQNWKTRKTD